MDTRRNCLLICTFLLFVTASLTSRVFGQNNNQPVYLPMLHTERSKQWLQIFAGEVETVQFISETVNGEFLLAGRIEQPPGSGQYNFWSAKTSPYGDLLWSLTYDESTQDNTLFATEATMDGGFIMAGRGNFSGENDAWIVRVDGDGQIIWQKRYSNGDMLDFAAAITSTRDGGFAVAGYTASFGVGISDLLVMKLDGQGNIVWQKTVHYGVFDYGQTIRQTNDGGYLITGYESNEGNHWVLKMDGEGQVLWFRIYPGVSITNLYLLNNDSFVLTGIYSDNDNDDIWVSQADSTGSLTWQKRFDGGGADQGLAIATVDAGELIVAGMTASAGDEGNDGVLLKLSMTGDLIWQNTFHVSESDQLQTLGLTGDGGIAMGGSTVFGGWALKVDPHGEIPFCNLIDLSLLVSANTLVVPANAPITLLDAAFVPEDTNNISQNYYATTVLLCPDVGLTACNQD